jgi:hypothetical protein
MKDESQQKTESRLGLSGLLSHPVTSAFRRRLTGTAGPEKIAVDSTSAGSAASGIAGRLSGHQPAASSVWFHFTNSSTHPGARCASGSCCAGREIRTEGGLPASGDSNCHLTALLGFAGRGTRHEQMQRTQVKRGLGVFLVGEELFRGNRKPTHNTPIITRRMWR